MTRKARSIMNRKELEATISPYSHFNFFLSASESIFICVNLLKKAESDPKSKMLLISESSNCSPSFLHYILFYTKLAVDELLAGMMMSANHGKNKITNLMVK